MSITRGNAENYVTDHQTVGGRNISIGVNDSGYYVIKVDGVGEKPKLCEQIFTSLSEARKAVQAYVIDHAVEINKRKFIEEMASKPSIKEQRKAERLASRNSE
jgi:hypothetical protein